MAENFEQNTPITDPSYHTGAMIHVPRWRMAAGAIGLSALAACGPAAHVSHENAPVTASPSVSASPFELSLPSNIESTQATVPPDVVKQVEEDMKGPEPLDPSKLENGQFVGAIQIFYANNPARSTDPNQTAVTQYFKNKGLKQPPMDNPAVHRVVASTVDTVHNTDVVSDEALAQGFVIDKTSSPNVLVVAEHDITPISAAVNVDGQEYNQSAMGINGLVEPGDELVITTPSNRLGYVNKYIFIADSSFTIAANNQEDINNKLFGNPDAGKTLLRLYKCWKPGDNQWRLVTEFHFSMAEIVQGNVAAVGPAGPPLPDR